MLFFGNKKVLGLDIGTSYIKAVQLRQGGKLPELESYGMVNVVYPKESKGKVNVLSQTAEIIRNLFERSQFSSTKAVVSLPANVVFVSILDLPSMPDKDLQQSIEYKAKKYIPLPLSEVNLSWQKLGDGQGLKTPTFPKKNGQAEQKIPEGGEVQVLLTAVAKNVVNNYLQILDLAGLEPVALEVETLSQIRALVDPGNSLGTLIVDIGAKTTNLTLVSNGYLHGSRHLTVGGDSITESIASSLGISFDRADEMKKNAFANRGAVPPLHATKTTLGVIKSECEQLMKIMTGQGKQVSKIILTGGGTQLPNLEKEFQTLGSKIERGNPLQKISYDKDLQGKLITLSPQLTVALGLALRSHK